MRWFTSDHHFDHGGEDGRTGILKHVRGLEFETIDDMNEAYVQRWNDVVADGDTVYHLGDFSMGGMHSLRFVGRLKGRKILVTGNHDKAFYGRREQVAKYLRAGFVEVVSEAQILLAGEMTTLSHFPFIVDHKPVARYIERRPKDVGQLLLHGHLHTPTAWTSDREIHVGVDAWDGYPVSESQLVQLITKGPDQA